MLTLACGMPKSASTYVFEILVRLCDAEGVSPQPSLRCGVCRRPGFAYRVRRFFRTLS